MNTTAEVIARLTAELASWEADFISRQKFVSTKTFATKKEHRLAIIELADFKKVVEGKRNRLNEFLAKV